MSIVTKTIFETDNCRGIKYSICGVCYLSKQWLYTGYTVRLFDINIYNKNFTDKHNKYLYIFPLSFRFHRDRRGLLVSLWGIHLFRLHRKRFSATNRQIRKYRKLHTKSNIRGVVYTCITGGYDNIITHRYLNPEYDYVCFTDNPDLLTTGHPVWQMKPLPFCDGDNVINSRFPKLNPHLALPEYESSIYVDANISFTSKHIFRVCEKSNKNILIPPHPDRDCIYDECKAVCKLNKEKPDAIFNVQKLLHTSGYPQNMGLTENNIIYRKHNDKMVVCIDSMWWDMFLKYSHRDQLTFGYVLWKNKIPFQDVYIPIRYSWDYIVLPHTKQHN